MLRFLSWCGVLAVASGSVAVAAEPSFADLELRLEQAIDAGEYAGGAHLVVRNDRTVHYHAAGYADTAKKIPFGRHTLLRIYSMTKPITSVAAMKLYEEGAFQLDDPVSRFIPAFAETKVLQVEGPGIKLVPAKRQITVRDVFRHTTGYSYGEGDPNPLSYYEKEGLRYRPPQAMMPPSMTIEEAAEAMAKIPALHHPGEKFTYGFNTDLLGRLVEIWSGMPLDRYLNQAIFRPLGMGDTAFSIPMAKHDRFASCYSSTDAGLEVVDGADESPFKEGFQFLSGGGGLVSTLHDYSVFCSMIVNGGSLAGRRIVDPETLELMFTDQLGGVAGEFKFGLGFAIAEAHFGSEAAQRTVARYRWAGYASTDFEVVPDEGMFQIMVFQRVPSSHALAREIFPRVYRRF